MEREVRYCTTEDGVRIAYRLDGDGPPLVSIPFFVESFSILPSVAPEWSEFYDILGQGRTLLRYDLRGTGLSQRDVDDLSPAALARDLEAVINAARLKRFPIFAQTAGGIRAIQYAANHPSQVTHLILVGTWARMADVMAQAALQSFAQLARANWLVAAQTLTDLRGRRAPDTIEAANNLIAADVYTESASGDVVADILLQHADADVTNLLPRIRAKTLIMHWMADEFVPLTAAQHLAANIPGSRLVTVEGPPRRDYWGLVTEALDEFLSDERRPRPRKHQGYATSFRTVLFTDLVGHTEMMSRLGDERGREVLRAHERITREVLKAHGGAEVKTMGDGFMASFGSVTKAVECAVALQRAFDRWNTGEGRDVPLERLYVRVGLNAGEPIEEDGDLFGATVILASRIAAKAEGGEILVADTVRGLCSGKGFLFSDRGEFVAKGFEEPVRVYEVRWRE